MTLQLALPPELERRLRQEAERRGQPTESVALRLLDEHLPPPLDERRAAAVSMLQRWAEENRALTPEEEAANADVLRSLDQDRPSYRKLFADNYYALTTSNDVPDGSFRTTGFCNRGPNPSKDTSTTSPV